jgi:hypothetical protein
MKNRIFGKGLAYGIIVLFLGMSIMPIAGSFSVEKHTSITNSVKELNTITKTESRDIYVILHGEMGENGWYISPYIHFEIIATNGSEVVAVYYKIDSGSWQTYTAEFLISTEGIHFLYLKVIDQYGNEWNFSFVIKFDFTPPIIVLHKENMFLHTIKFIADVSDMESGVWRVEFYLDDELKVTDYDFPFEWIWKGTGNHTVTAKVFDWAGHSASSSLSTPYVQSQSSPSVQQNSQNQQINQLLQNLILRHQMIS